MLGDNTSEFLVRVIPRASVNRIKVESARDDGRPFVYVYVTAPPEDGKANKMVIALISKSLGVPKSSVTIVRGKTNRDKMIKIIR